MRQILTFSLFLFGYFGTPSAAAGSELNFINCREQCFAEPVAEPPDWNSVGFREQDYRELVEAHRQSCIQRCAAQTGVALTPPAAGPQPQLRLNARTAEAARSAPAAPRSGASDQRPAGEAVRGERGPVHGGSGDREEPSRDTDRTAAAPETGRANATAEEELAQILSECERAETRTRHCCQDPVRCVDSESSVGSSELTVVATFITTGLAISGGAGLEQQCRNGEILGNGAGLMNAAMAGACATKKSECTRTCQEALDEYIARNATGENGRGINHVERARGKVRQCNRYNADLMRLGQQATSGFLSAQLAQLCRQNATATASTVDRLDPRSLFNDTCADPANASNPLCRNLCSRPENANNPLCGANSKTDSLGDGVARTTSTSAFGRRQEPNVGLTDAAGTQLPNSGGGAIQPRRANAMTGGAPTAFAGGGSALSSGSGGGFGGLYGSGYDTQILKGVGGGGGYATNGGGAVSAGGGFSGYGTANRDPADADKFDIRKYLPGAGQGGDRQIAGTPAGVAPAEIGGRFDDLFRRISRRFYNLCLNNRLLDCDTDLKAMRKRLEP